MNIQLPKNLQKQNKTINLYATCRKIKTKHKQIKNGRNLSLWQKFCPKISCYVFP